MFLGSHHAFWYAVIIIERVLSVFTAILFSLHHWDTFTRSEFSLDSNLSIVVALVWMVESSAYMSVVALFVTSGISFINNMNSRGPRMDSWGIPQVTCWLSDVSPRKYKYYSNHDRHFESHLYSQSLSSSSLWLTRSNALWRPKTHVLGTYVY